MECVFKDNVLFDEGMTIYNRTNYVQSIMFCNENVVVYEGYTFYGSTLWCSEVLYKDGILLFEDDGMII